MTVLPQDPRVQIAGTGKRTRGVVRKMMASLAVLCAAGGLVAFATFGAFEHGDGTITPSVVAPSR